jgi:flavin-binding protein dodecin
MPNAPDASKRTGSSTVLARLQLPAYCSGAGRMRAGERFETQPQGGVVRMANHTYKLTEIVGTSPESIETAVNNALARAKKTVRNMRWFEVQQVRGHIEDGAVDHWQVILKIGFTLDD